MTIAKDTSAPTLVDLLFEDATVGRCLVAPDATILRANREWLRSTGFTADQVLGADIVELFPATRDMALAMHARARAGHRVEVPRHAQVIAGRETWWEGSIDPVPMDRGTGLLITAREVTGVGLGGAAAAQGGEAERERLVGELDRRARELEATFASIADGVILYGPAGAIVAMNGAAEEILGFTRAEYEAAGSLAQRAALVRVRTGDGQPFPVDAVPTARALRGETVRDVAMLLEGRDRPRRWVSASAAPIRSPDGAIVGAVASFHDVTARRSAEEALRESTQVLRAISDTSQDVIYAKDRDGRLRFANPATLTLIGKPPGEVLGHTDAELLADADAARAVAANDRRIMSTGLAEEVEERVPLPDGTDRIWLSRKSPYRDDAGRVIGLLGISRDVTDRRRSELAVRASEGRLRLALAAARMTAWEFDPSTGEVTLTDNATDVLAVRSGRLHTNSQQGYGLIHPDDVERHRALVTAALEQGDGYVSVYRQVADSGEVLWIEERGQAVTDAAGRTVRLVGVTQNVTERKRGEDALREADRRKDEFLAMLAHELRNPLAPIRNSTYILRHAQPGSDQARRSQEVIERQTHHLARLVDDLLDVTRIARGKIELRRERVDLREVVVRAADDYRFRMDENGVAFRVRVADARLWADADPTRLAQVVGNLLHNAAKFTRRGDEVVLAVTPAGPVAEIRVRDTGAGIDAALLPTVFEPFVQADQSLARTQGGLGLGLALVKGIVELHGGTVRAESGGKGRGAEFVLRIPLVEVPASGDRDAKAGRPVEGGGRRVLVVDDNRDAAESLADLVRILGHHAEVAFDGPTAVERARVMVPDVVLCDLGLPGMSGYEVARRLRALGGATQLVAVSGYAQPEDVKRAIETGFDAHVAKPPDVALLERLLG